MGDQALEDLDDELLLDDDLFGSMDDNDSLFGEEKKEESEEDDGDIFAGLDESDLDFDLEGEDGEDLFAAIDDSGDLDTDFGDLSSSNNGINVNGDEILKSWIRLLLTNLCWMSFLQHKTMKKQAQSC